MIRRSFNSRFRNHILAELKITTIRDRAWPVGVPIMAFQWAGKPYRSKQIEICPIVVEETAPVTITNTGVGVVFAHGMNIYRPLWATEGFADAGDLQSWFAAILKPEQSATKILHRFRLAE